MPALSESEMKLDLICTVSPEEVDSGADITLKFCVTCPREWRESSVSIRNHEEAELVRAGLRKSGDEAYETDDIVLAAPRIVGEHVYRAVLVVTDKGGSAQEQAATDVRFVVKPHAALLNVWDLPSAIPAGERFKFTVGVKCTAGCDLGGQPLHVVRGDGSQACAVSLGRAIWPGTEALYFAEIETEAPASTGDDRWEVGIAALDCEHAAGSVSLTLRVVSPPDCVVTIEALDRETQKPIENARVVMHPYRAATDANGVARLRVTKGEYDILVSGSKYIPATTSVTVAADLATRAELDAEPPADLQDEAW